MAKDVLYALRGLVRQPLFSAVAILTLALGIGANTAIFTVTNAVLLRPLPYPQPERLMMLWTHNPRQGYEKDVATYPNFDDWRRSSQTFASISGYISPSFSLTELGDPVQIRGAVVTPEFFETMGMPPLFGRGFTADDAAGDGRKAVISYGFWRNRLGDDRAAVGRMVTLNGARYEVVGVMPATFAHPADAEVWVPMTASGPYGELFTQRGAFWLTVIGRLKDGVTQAVAQSEMDAIAARLEQQYPANAGLGIRLVTLHAEIVGDVRRPLLILLGAVSFVLLIACANVTNLLLTRASVRQRELAIRAALGAGRARLLRQMLTESVVLAAAGGVAGLLLALAGVRLLQSVAPAALPRLDEIPLDWRVLAYALSATVASGLLFGAVPALQASRSTPADPLRSGTRGAGDASAGRRTRATLATVQLAIAVALLIGAGLLIRTIVALNNADIGFATRNVLVMRVELPRLKYDSPERVQAFYRELTERVASLPGVEAAGAGSSVLGHASSAGIAIEGRPAVGADQQDIPVPYDAVSPTFFQTMQIPLLRGRMVAETDTAQTPPVAVVNDAFVRRFFPDQDALGKRFTFGNPTAPDNVWTTIVGVVADTRREGYDRPVRAEVYFPHTQYSERRLFVVMRTAGDPLALASAAKAQVWAIDNQQPVASVRTVAEAIARSEANRRFMAQLLGIFAAVALALAVIGVYGVVAYATTQRTHEIGIRMALGADRRSVRRLVIESGMKLVAGGLAMGLVAAFALTHVLAGLLFGVSARDPLTFVVVAVGLGTAGLVASWLPARRAIRIEPVAALKGE